jgi:Ca2+-binding RTX toxin-like protein
MRKSPGLVALGPTTECDGLEPTITGTDGPDHLVGTAGDDVILGLDGNDDIQALGGDDIVCSGPGDDTIDMGSGGPSADRMDLAYAGAGDDVISGGPDQDQIAPGAGDDVVHGGSQPFGYPDFLTFLWATTGVAVDIGAGSAAGEGDDQFDGIEAVDGSLYSDVLVGDEHANILNGGGYLLFTGETVYDEAADALDAGPNVDVGLWDLVYGEGGDDQLLGAEGTQQIFSGDGDDEIAAGPGDDGVEGNGGDDLVRGGPGDDQLFGWGGRDRVLGGPDDDVVYGDGGDDSVLGGAGDDQLYPTAGDDEVDGGSNGAVGDTLSYAYAGRGVNANLTTGAATGEGTDRLDGIENVFGSLFDDRLIGDAGDNQLWGGISQSGDQLILDSADDVLLGKGGDFDQLLGLEGDDTVNGGPGIGDTASFLFSFGPVNADLAAGVASGEGDDVLSAVEVLDGSFFDDRLTGDGVTNILIGNLGNDSLSGGEGGDIALFDQIYVDFDIAQAFLAHFGMGPATYHSIQANLTNGTATGEGSDTLDSIEVLSGGPKADSLTGDDNPNGLFGAEGDDALTGLGGSDLLLGEEGNDRLDGGEGFYDLASYAFAPGAISANLGTGVALGDGQDSLASIEAVVGSAFADDLTGDGLANFLLGSGEDDRLRGLAGDDYLAGGSGSDSLEGDEGIDNCSTGESEDGCEGDDPPPEHPLADLVALLEGFRHH